MNEIKIAVTHDDAYWDRFRAIVRAEIAREREERAINPPQIKRLTVKQAAVRFGFSEYSLRNKIFLKQIPVHRNGGSVYFIQEEIETWLKEGK